MKTPRKTLLSALGACTIAALLQALPASAQIEWTGAAGTTNWSDINNWGSPQVPNINTGVVFGNTYPGTNNGQIDNIVDTTFQIPTFNYSTITPNGYHTTLIDAPQALNINGAGGVPLQVYYGQTAASGQNVYSRIVGSGTLSVTNTTGNINIFQWGDNTDHRATLDLTGLTNFNADVDQVLVSVTATTGEQYIMSSLLLAQTNFIHIAAGTARPGILIGSMNNASTGKRGNQELVLGTHNTIQADTISVGGFKMDGVMRFRTGATGGNAILRGSAGTDRVKTLAVGDHRATVANYASGNTSAAVTGTLNLNGNTVDALVADLFIARSQLTNSGATTGTMSMDMGAMDVDNAYVGYHITGVSGSGTSPNALGTLNLGGTATMTVNNDMLLARKLGSSTPTATLNLSSNSVLNVKGNILSGGGNSTINLSGNAMVDMQPAGDATPGNVTVSTLTGSGLVTNVVTLTNLTSLNPGTAILPGTLNIWGNLTVATNATVTFNLSNSPAGAKDLVNVQGTGNLTFNNNTLNLAPISPSLDVGSYPLFGFTGTRTGTLNFTNTSRYVAAVDYAANQVNLVVSGGAPESLKWASTATALWDLTTTNWSRVPAATPDRFFSLDSVLFDESVPATNLVLLSTALAPSTVTVNSATRNYSFGGSGRITGGASIIKNGASTLVISNANDFNGPVVVNGGMLVLANAAALGTADAGTFITPGATLDVRGSSAGNDLVTIAGTGLNNTGAVFNSGSRADSGIRLLVLTNDATVAHYGAGRWDVRGAGGSGSFNGLLDLNGYTLSSRGSTQFSVVDATVTNVGNFVVESGTLSMTRSKVDGAGTINVRSNDLFFENYATGYVAKPIIVDNGSIRAIGNTFSLWSPITNLSGGVRITAGNPFTITNVITGPGAVTKLGGSSMTLQAANDYTGPTTISAGQLILGTNASLASPSIAVGGGTVFNVSALPGGFTLASGQTLSGSGTVIGDVTAGTGTSVLPGTSAGTLTFNNNLSLANVTTTFELAADPTIVGSNINDLILVSSNLTLSGVNSVKINPLATLSGASPYTLFVYSNALTGGAANLNVSSDSRYSFTVVDPTTTPGAIQVSVTGSGSSANLLWKGNAPSNPTLWDTKVTANWLNGVAPDLFYLGDNVAFDDSASTASITLVGSVRPAAMGMTNNSLGYTFSNGSLIAGSLAKEGSASLTFSGTGTHTISSGALFNGGTTTFANSGGVTFASGATVESGSLVLANPVQNTFNAPLTVNGGSAVFNQPVNVVFSAALADNQVTSGTVVKQNSNILTLSGNNTNFNGPIVISAGTVQAQNGNALGSAVAGTTVASGATLDVNGFSLYNPGDEITISGNGVAGRGAILNDSVTAQQNAIRAVILAANAAIGAPNLRWDIRGPGGSGTFTGVLNLNDFTLTKLGPGQISVVDAEVASGNIDIQGGLMAFTRCNLYPTGLINVRSNILLFENYSSGSISKDLLVNGGTVRLTGNSTTLSGTVTNQSLGGTFDIASGQTLTAANTVGGPGALTKITAGTLALAAPDNSWTGGTIISGGTLMVGTDPNTANGSIPNLPILNNGILYYNSALNFTNDFEISGTGQLTKRGNNSVLTITASNSFSGNVNTGTGTSPQAGGIILLKNSYGFGNTNKTVNIIRAELQLDGGVHTPTNVTFQTSQHADITDMSWGGGYVAIRNMTGSNSINGLITLAGGAGNSEFSVGGGSLGLNTDVTANSTVRTMVLSGDAPGYFNGALTNNGVNIPALLKRGANTWLLNGHNTYTGNTTVREGTLALSATGSISNSPIIQMESNAVFNVSAVVGGFVLGTNQTLRGTGTLVGSVNALGTVSPGLVAAGTETGTLTFNNAVTLAGATVMDINKTNTPTADQIVAGTLTYGGTLTVTNVGDPLIAGDTFDLFNVTTGSGAFTLTSLPALDPGLGWDTSALYTTGVIKVIATINLDKANLQYQVTGNTLEITWPSDKIGMTLQAQTNAISIGYSSNWFAVPGSTTTNKVILPIDAANGTVFYRLVY